MTFAIVCVALLALLVVLFLFGFAKAGLRPVHGVLPAARFAPTPVSSFLHGVAVVKAKLRKRDLLPSNKLEIGCPEKN